MPVSLQCRSEAGYLISAKKVCSTECNEGLSCCSEEFSADGSDCLHSEKTSSILEIFSFMQLSVAVPLTNRCKRDSAKISDPCTYLFSSGHDLKVPTYLPYLPHLPYLP